MQPPPLGVQGEVDAVGPAAVVVEVVVVDVVVEAAAVVVEAVVVVTGASGVPLSV